MVTVKLRDYIDMAHGGSLSEFARELGVSRWTVSRYVAGRVPKHEVMVKIAEVSKGAVGPVDFYDMPRGAP